MQHYYNYERQRRISSLLMWRRLAASLLLDVIAVTLLLWFFDDDYSPGIEIWEIAIGVGVLFVGEIFFAIRRWLWLFISSLVVAPALSKVEFLDALRSAKIAWPDYLARRFNSLAEIADDAELDAKTRVTAASLFATWTTAMNLRGSAAAIMLEGAWDDAIREYVEEQAKSARPRQKRRITEIDFAADDLDD